MYSRSSASVGRPALSLAFCICMLPTALARTTASPSGISSQMPLMRPAANPSPAPGGVDYLVSRKCRSGSAFDRALVERTLLSKLDYHLSGAARDVVVRDLSGPVRPQRVSASFKLGRNTSADCANSLTSAMVSG